jgi:hypothetical protein
VREFTSYCMVAMGVCRLPTLREGTDVHCCATCYQVLIRKQYLIVRIHASHTIQHTQTNKFTFNPKTENKLPTPARCHPIAGLPVMAHFVSLIISLTSNFTSE